jgi:hypothetical protein
MSAVLRVRRGLAACVAVLVVACAGCARNPGRDTPAPQQTLGSGVEVTVLVVDDLVAATIPPPPVRTTPPRSSSPSMRKDLQATPAPGIAGRASMGLEEALAPYVALPTPLSDSVRRAWIANGLLACVIPASSVPAFCESVRIAGPLQRQFFAQTTRWAQVFRGPQAMGIHPIELDSGVIDVGSGAFRLLMRCYPTPDAGVGEARQLHLDLVPQHIDQKRGIAFAKQDANSDPLAPPPPAPTIADQGAVLEHLLAEIALAQDEALVILPQADAASPTPDDPPSPGRPFGPALPTIPNLAQALLSDALVGGDCRRRAVLVFRPILPAPQQQNQQ